MSSVCPYLFQSTCKIHFRLLQGELPRVSSHTISFWQYTTQKELTDLWFLPKQQLILILNSLNRINALLFSADAKYVCTCLFSSHLGTKAPTGCLSAVVGQQQPFLLYPHRSLTK